MMACFDLKVEQLFRKCYSSERKGFPNKSAAALRVKFSWHWRANDTTKSHCTANLTQGTYWERPERVAAAGTKQDAGSFRVSSSGVLHGRELQAGDRWDFKL